VVDFFEEKLNISLVRCRIAILISARTELFLLVLSSDLIGNMARRQ